MISKGITTPIMMSQRDHKTKLWLCNLKKANCCTVIGNRIMILDMIWLDSELDHVNLQKQDLL